MSHSLSKIWIHAIWSTKNRERLITPHLETRIYEYLANQLIELGCKVNTINGMPDHIHCLFLLNQQKSVSEVMKQIKGSSSHFINQNDLIDSKFSWQTGYAAFSVSESMVSKTDNYIKNQKAHHTKRSFQEEYTEFMNLYGLQL
ncbi:MAG: IS200/IS605 family transposase [Bacteroidota bacterium]